MDYYARRLAKQYIDFSFPIFNSSFLLWKWQLSFCIAKGLERCSQSKYQSLIVNIGWSSAQWYISLNSGVSKILLCHFYHQNISLDIHRIWVKKSFFMIWIFGLFGTPMYHCALWRRDFPFIMCFGIRGHTVWERNIVWSSFQLTKT